jgi:hypothetical protein
MEEYKDQTPSQLEGGGMSKTEKGTAFVRKIEMFAYMQ